MVDMLCNQTFYSVGNFFYCVLPIVYIFIEVNLLKFQVAYCFIGIPFINTPLFIKINK